MVAITKSWNEHCLSVETNDTDSQLNYSPILAARKRSNTLPGNYVIPCDISNQRSEELLGWLSFFFRF